jgi:hypothetical protein
MVLPSCSLFLTGSVIFAAFFVSTSFLHHQILLQTDMIDATLLVPLLGLLSLWLAVVALRFH